MCILLITQLLQLVERLGPVKQFNHISWVAVATPSDLPKSVHNRFVTEVFGGVLVSFIRILCFDIRKTLVVLQFKMHF